MSERKWASGRWQVMASKESEFIERWTAWLTWTSQNFAGFRSAMLLRSDDDADRFTSFSEWDDEASVSAWLSNADNKQRVGTVRELCDEFVGGDFTEVAAVQAP
jgi:heme-degrading monooxygenase HmoA